LGYILDDLSRILDKGNSGRYDVQKLSEN